MSLIQLPPGMTAEQYMATPEGQRVSQELAKFQAWMDAQQRRSGSPYGPPMGDALPPPESAPAARPRQPAQRQPVTRRGKTPLSQGRAQPKADPAMNSMRLMDATVSDLSAALAEMFPELGVGERSMLARELAEEYMRERREAASALKPKHPVAPMTEQMEFDTAFSKMSQERAREERMRKRMEEAMKKYNWDEPGKPAKQAPRPRVTPGQAQPVAPPASAADWVDANRDGVHDLLDPYKAGQEGRWGRYGGWIGTDPNTTYYMTNFQDHDRDGVDDRWQSGPGQPSQMPRATAHGQPATKDQPIPRGGADAIRMRLKEQQDAERRKARSRQNYENNPAVREMVDRDRQIQLGLRPAYTP